MFTPAKRKNRRETFLPKPNPFVCKYSRPSGLFIHRKLGTKGWGWFHFEVSFSVHGGVWKLSCFPNLEPVFFCKLQQRPRLPHIPPMRVGCFG